LIFWFLFDQAKRNYDSMDPEFLLKEQLINEIMKCLS
jgi:hypothetical protein